MSRKTRFKTRVGSPSGSALAVAVSNGHLDVTPRERDVPVTKVQVPRIRSAIIHRERLLTRFEHALEGKLTLVCAPAGFGKTTAVLDWINSRRTTRRAARSVVWLALEEGDNEPARFLEVLRAALHAADPRFGAVAVVPPGFPPAHALRTVVTRLINGLKSSGPRVLVVLEDYHMIRERQIHDAVAYLLEHAPPSMHVVIVTREDPPLPLARLRAGNAMCELRAADLRFTTEEAAVLIRDIMKRKISSADVAALTERTEGWAVGLRLALMSLPEEASEVHRFIADLAASRRYMLEYLRNEILARQPPAVAAFLRRTAVLDRFSLPLCAAVLGDEALTETRALLDEIERRDLFLTPLDSERRWYRYHRLFADLLRAHLQQVEPALALELHRRASQWFEANALWDEAIQHALAASDLERAGGLVARLCPEMAMRGEYDRLLGWCHRLPAAVMQSHPRLLAIHAWAHVMTGEIAKAQALLQEAEQRLPADAAADDARTVHGNLAIIRAFLTLREGNLAGVASRATDALALLPEREKQGRAAAYRLAAAAAFRATGDVTAASERRVLDAVERIRRIGDPALLRRSLNDLGRLYMYQGRLRRADLAFREAGDLLSLREPTAGRAYCFWRGDLWREWNDLERAETLVQDGIESLPHSELIDVWAAFDGYYTLARIRQARGASAGAMAALDAFTALVQQGDIAQRVSARAAAARAHLWMMQGNHAAAFRWADTSGLDADDPADYALEVEHGVLAVF